MLSLRLPFVGHSAGRRSGSFALAAVLAISTITSAGTPCRADLTPESPEVRAAVELALKFLSEADYKKHDGDRIDHRVGGDCLIALALIKGHPDPGGNRNHPRVRKAIASARTAIRSDELANAYGRIYCTSLAIIFLSALDANEYQSEIEQLLNLMLRFQEEDGGFRDGSMSQYATLAMWEAQKSGVRVPPTAWQQLALFWANGVTHDGRFPYMPSSDQAMRPSLSMGALGSLYVCYAAGQRQREEQQEKDADGDPVAGALKPVGEEPRRNDQPAQVVRIDRAAVRQAMNKSEAWYRGHGNKPPQMWVYYYYYGIERYQAFREVVTNSFPEAPAWYQEVAGQLLATQREDGSWKSGFDGPNPGLVGTSYAVLFLVRSTKMRAQSLGDGRLVGGRGIPNLDATVEVSNGRIRIKPLQGPAEDLIKIISDPQNGQYHEALAGLEELVAEADDVQLSKHTVRFRELAESDDPTVVAAAITAMARTRNLDEVPFLIYTLADDSPEVVKAADDGLRFISRKFNGVGLNPAAPLGERAEAIERWKQWLLSIRPDAKFDR